MKALKAQKCAENQKNRQKMQCRNALLFRDDGSNRGEVCMCWRSLKNNRSKSAINESVVLESEPGNLVVGETTGKRPILSLPSVKP